jgi:hypothetical protein
MTHPRAHLNYQDVAEARRRFKERFPDAKLLRTDAGYVVTCPSVTLYAKPTVWEAWTNADLYLDCLSEQGMYYPPLSEESRRIHLT